MIRSTEIPKLTPGEILTAGRMNQLAAAANRVRVGGGDGTIQLSLIGGAIGASFGGTMPNSDTSVLVKVLPVSQSPANVASDLFWGGVYEGRLYINDLTIPQPGKSDTPPLAVTMPDPFPDSQTCYVLNLGEVGLTTNSISAVSYFVGKIIGFLNGFPLVAISSGATGIMAKISAVSGTTPGPWNYTAQSYDSAITYAVVRNGMEKAAVGSPGSQGVTIGTNGTVNGGSCVLQSIGIGAEVLLMPDPTVSGGWVFSLTNWAQ